MSINYSKRFVVAQKQTPSVKSYAWLAAFVLLSGQSAFGQAVLERYNFSGESNQATSAADASDANLDNISILARGPTAAASAGSNSFRTQGFQNNGISTSNTDYFQFTASAASGFTLSLSSIAARFNGTGTYLPASTQFAYSLDGAAFTLFGSATSVPSFNTTVTYDLSNVSALQAVDAATTVTLRFYASGQTTTGGFGFASDSAATGSDGLVLLGSIDDAPAAPEPTTAALFGLTASGLLLRRSRSGMGDGIKRRVRILLGSN